MLCTVTAEWDGCWMHRLFLITLTRHDLLPKIFMMLYWAKLAAFILAVLLHVTHTVRNQYLTRSIYFALSKNLEASAEVTMYKATSKPSAMPPQVKHDTGVRSEADPDHSHVRIQVLVLRGVSAAFLERSVAEFTQQRLLGPAYYYY